MAELDQSFKLDFKFGGNVEFLAKIEQLLERVDARFNSVEDAVSGVANATDEMAESVDDLNDSLKNGLSFLSSFGEKLKDIAGYYLSFQAAKMGAERVWSFGRESMEAYSTQERAENQLKGVMQNRGTLDQFETIKNYASEIQNRSIYGDETMIKAAGELATYVKGTESLKSMMDLLTNYAAGMTGGGEVSPEQMESLATGLGMAYDGNYMAMRRKGFDTSKLEALDALAENGGTWGAEEKQKYGDVLDKKLIKEAKRAGGVTEQMRVDALKESLADWDKLSDAVNGLNSSAIVRLNNKISDLQENLGERLYPTFNKLVESVDKHMPDIEEMFNSIGDLFETFVETLDKNIDLIRRAASAISSLISFAAKFPKATIAVGIALKSLSSGAIFAEKGFASLNTQLKTSFVNIVKMHGAIGGLVGAAAGGVAFGFSADVGSENSFGDNSVGALQAMAEGAAVGAAQFGLLGAAIGAASSTLTMFIRGLIELYQVSEENEKREQDEADRDKAYEKMVEARAKWKKKSDQNDYKQNYSDYVNAVNEYREFTQGLLPSYIQNEMYAENAQKARTEEQAKKAAKEAQKDAKVNLHQEFTTNNIEQKVNVAAEVEKIGLLLNMSVRAAIESGLKKNNAVLSAQGV